MQPHSSRWRKLSVMAGARRRRKMFDWVKEYERKRASASGHQTVEDAQRRCKILLLFAPAHLSD